MMAKWIATWAQRMSRLDFQSFEEVRFFILLVEERWCTKWIEIEPNDHGDLAVTSLSSVVKPLICVSTSMGDYS